jgi:hypothetical protein
MRIKSKPVEKVHIAFHWKYKMKITNLVQLQRLVVASTIELNTGLQNPRPVIYNKGSMCTPTYEAMPQFSLQVDLVLLYKFFFFISNRNIIKSVKRIGSDSYSDKDNAIDLNKDSDKALELIKDSSS